MPDLECDDCGRHFSRTEHLTRHQRSHTREKPFACSLCSKAFSRSDILHRHQSAHQPHGSEKAARVATATFRACLECASGRVKCSGGSPCSRCASRAVECQYPSKRRRRTIAGESRETSETSTESAYVDLSTLANAADELSPTGDVSTHRLVEGPSPSALARPEAYQNPWSRGVVAIPPIPVNSSRGNQDMNAGVPSSNSSNNRRSNYAPQMPTAGFLQTNNDIFINNGTFPAYAQQQFNDHEFSSINWLPLVDPIYGDWDMSSWSYGGLGSNHREIPSPTAEGIGQPTFLADSVMDVTQNMSPRQAADRISANEHTSPVGSGPVSTSSMSHSSPSVANPSTVSTHYVDGAGGRTTASTKSRRVRSISKDWTSEHTQSVNGDGTHGFDNIDLHLEGSLWVSAKTYEEILENVRNEEVTIPPRPLLNTFIQRYFDNFHSVFPLLHKTSFGQGSGAWKLVIAAAAIGAVYARTVESRRWSEALHKLLHGNLEKDDTSERSSFQFASFVHDSGRDNMAQVQARILNVIGMAHSGKEELIRLARTSRSYLVATCLHMGLLNSSDNVNSQEVRVAKHQQVKWLKSQIRIRTGYFIWLLDCMMAYESDFRPQMQLLDAKAPLPCEESMWDETDFVLNQGSIQKNEPPSLCSAVEALYMEKKILPHVGELGRILIIHALYQRTWDVSNYHRSILSTWNPTAKIESVASVASRTETWLPSVPMVSRWRNIACDALDILHWSANSSIAQAAGLEHPTIIHLHLARLILLTPVIQIQELAACITQSSPEKPRSASINRKKETEARNEILRWVVQDQYKARLAIIHAGTIFWNARRYSYDSPIEPFAVYLASLVVWAYGSSSRMVAQRKEIGQQMLPPIGGGTSDQENANSNPSFTIASVIQRNEHRGSSVGPDTRQRSSSPEPEPSFLHLDRPCDDELVQLFVRVGHKMTGYMIRVGDICASSAAPKVLREGSRILQGEERESGESGDGSLPTWGLAETFKERLESLAREMDKQTA